MRRFPLPLALAWLALCAAAPAQLPDLSATSVGGEALHLARDARQVVIVHFWATWCVPCRVEMPMLDAVARRHGAGGVRVVGIALDAGASRKRIAAAGMGVGFPLARLGDTNLRPGMVPAALPETLIYGRDGRLRYRFHAGGTMLDAATLERILPPLLAER